MERSTHFDGKRAIRRWAAYFRLVDRGDDRPLRFRNRAVKNEFYWDSNRYPCQTPPWGQLNAIDLNTGEFRWRSVLGEFDELTRRGVPKTGAPNLGDRS